MAYFTDPMKEEFRKAIEDVLKEGKGLEDPDAIMRSSKRKSETDPAKKSKKGNQSKKKSRKVRKKFSPKIAKSLR